MNISQWCKYYGVMGMLVGLMMLGQAANANTINTQISVATDGTLANGSWGLVRERPAISADGRVIAFSTDATNLDALGDNNEDDIFVHAWDNDDNRTTTRVSIAHDGGLANGRSIQPSISADGNVIVFSSNANNLVEGDENEKPDIFVHYRDSGSIQLVSVPYSSQGETDPQANGKSGSPAISANGRYVAFVSNATNLVDNPPSTVDGTRGHLYLRDLQNNTTEYIGGEVDRLFLSYFDFFPSNMIAISDNGQYIAYYSRAGISVNDRVRLHDRETGEYIVIDCPVCGGDESIAREVAISGNGRYVVYEMSHGFNNSKGAVYLYDREDEGLRAVALGGYDGLYTYDQGSTNADISADGRYLVYTARSEEYGDPEWPSQDALVFVENLETGETQCVSVSDNGTPSRSFSFTSALSADGTYVLFGSYMPDLVEGGTFGYSLYRHDRINGLGCTTSLTRDEDDATVIIIDEDSITVDGDNDTTATTSGGGGGGALGLVGLLGLTMLLLRRRLHIGF